MADNEQHVSRHHHSHGKRHEDGAAIFKRKSLSAIERRKKISKALFMCTMVLAIIMMAAAAYAYLYSGD